MKRALEETKRLAGQYKYHKKEKQADDVLLTEEDDDVVQEHENYDITELMTDNRILLDRVDQLLDLNPLEESSSGQAIPTYRSTEQSEELESLTSSLIDGLFSQLKKTDVREKTTAPCIKKKKAPTNYVGAKKQVVTFDKASYAKKTSAAKKPATKSRLFDYQQKQKASQRS